MVVLITRVLISEFAESDSHTSTGTGISIPPKSFVVLFLCHAEALKVPLMIHTTYRIRVLEYIPHTGIMIPVSFNEQHDNVRILQRYATLSRENSS